MKRSAPLKRSPMNLGQPLRRTSGEARATVKVRKCAVKTCRQPFVPRSMTHRACGPDCAEIIGRAEAEKKALRAALEDRKKTRAELEALKTVPQLKKEAQVAFNSWVRRRDWHQPCISCGAPPPDPSGLHAGRDCGHYRSTGAADHLRFEPDNAHAQCVSCNQHKAGNVVAYRQGLLARIGVWRLESLENNSRPIKWTRDALRVIRDTYREKANELKQAAR